MLAFLSSAWTWITGAWTKILIIGGILAALIVAIYVMHLRLVASDAQIKSLQQSQQIAVDAATHDKEELQRELDDSKRQADLLAQEASTARQEATAAAKRYQQIMEEKNAKDRDGPVAPVLRDTLGRLRQ